MSPDDNRYQLLRQLETNPDLSQRQLAEAMGVSVGKAHYLLRGLIEKGYVKAANFRNSSNKRAYFYQLTPAGVTEKMRITRRYLARRQREYEQIRAEIAALEAELGEE